MNTGQKITASVPAVIFHLLIAFALGVFFAPRIREAVRA